MPIIERNPDGSLRGTLFAGAVLAVLDTPTGQEAVVWVEEIGDIQTVSVCAALFNEAIPDATFAVRAKTVEHLFRTIRAALFAEDRRKARLPHTSKPLRVRTSDVEFLPRGREGRAVWFGFETINGKREPRILFRDSLTGTQFRLQPDQIEVVAPEQYETPENVLAGVAWNRAAYAVLGQGGWASYFISITDEPSDEDRFFAPIPQFGEVARNMGALPAGPNREDGFLFRVSGSCELTLEEPKEGGVERYSENLVRRWTSEPLRIEAALFVAGDWLRSGFFDIVDVIPFVPDSGLYRKKFRRTPAEIQAHVEGRLDALVGEIAREGAAA